MQDVKIKYTTDIAGLQKALSAFSKLTDEEKEQVKQLASLQNQAKKTGDSLEKAGKSGKSSFEGFNNTITNIGGAIAGAFALDQILSFGEKVIEITAEFEKLKAVLSTALGSDSEGEAAFAFLQAKASETNFSVLELTDSYVKLVNAGFKPTSKELTNLTDLANSTGKGFDQLTEAIIDAQTGEFERLKEFGIRASKEGDNVRFSFKGVETQVKFTTGAITDYITGLGKLNGVAGTTEKISQTLGGRISNLGDAIDNFFASIGNSTSGIGGQFIQFLTDATNAASRFFVTLREETAKEQLVKIKQAQEEVNEALKAGIEFHQRQGASAEEASNLAKKSLTEGITERLVEARQKLKDLSEAFDSQQANVSKFAKTLEEDTPFGALFDTEADLAEQYANEVIKARGTVQALEAQLKELRKEAEKPIAPKVDTKELEKFRDEYAKLVEDLDLKKFISDVDLNEALLGAEFPTVAGERAVAARESITREFNRIISATESVGKKLVDAGLIKKSDLDRNLKMLRDTLKNKIDEINAQIDNGELAIKDPFIKSTEYAENTAKTRAISTEKFLDRVERSMKEFSDKFEADEEARLKRQRDRIERRNAFIEESFNTLNTFSAAFNEIESNRISSQIDQIQKTEQTKLAIVGNNEQAQNVIREESNRRQIELRRKQAKDEKAQAIFQTVINGATGIGKTISQYGMPLALPFIALVAAQTAIQIAAISSRPLPQFRHGVIDLDGPGTATSDSIMARLSKGESVMTARETQDFKPLLMAIRSGKADPELMNPLALGKLPVGAMIQQPANKALESAFVQLSSQHEAVLHENRKMRQVMENLKIYNVSMDEKGFNKSIQQNNYKAQILNDQFPK